jgi:hypothetical protein
MKTAESSGRPRDSAKTCTFEYVVNQPCWPNLGACALQLLRQHSSFIIVHCSLFTAHCSLLMRFKPVVSYTNLDLHRYLQTYGMFHQHNDVRLYSVNLIFMNIEYQFIMHLHRHPRS